MKIITRQDLANTVAEQWEEQYPIHSKYFDGGKIIASLRELGDNPDPDMVDQIIGNRMWTRSRCPKCRQVVDNIIVIGDKKLCPPCYTEFAIRKDGRGVEILKELKVKVEKVKELAKDKKAKNKYFIQATIVFGDEDIKIHTISNIPRLPDDMIGSVIGRYVTNNVDNNRKEIAEILDDKLDDKRKRLKETCCELLSASALAYVRLDQKEESENEEERQSNEH